MLLWAAWGWLSGWLRTRQAQSWPSASGLIDRADRRHKVERRFRDNGNRWTGEIGYSYKVNGKVFSGIYTRGFRPETDADEFLRDLIEKPIRVQFNPTVPGDSILSGTDVDALLTLRDPLSEEATRNMGIASPVPIWARPLLWPLITLSAVGSIVGFSAVAVHMWELPLGKEYLPLLGKGAWLVGLPSLLIGQITLTTAGRLRSNYFWKQALKDCRRGMTYLVSILGVVVVVKLAFDVFFADSTGLGEQWHTGPTGCALICLGSVLVLRPLAEMALRRCSNGHKMQRGLTTCPQCGAPVSR